MTDTLTEFVHRAAVTEIRSLATSLETAADLDPLLARLDSVRFAALGEASHGTHEFYTWRAELTKRLIEEKGFNWIGVEGDWPDCWRINQWVRDLDPEQRHLSAVQVLAGFERWPTWMWANREVAEFLDWLHQRNLELPASERVGFYGLDVYSLWDSLRRIMNWLHEHQPEALPAVYQAWQCFLPYHEDPHRYAWSTRLVPETCEADVVALLTEVRHQALVHAGDESAFDAIQNAEVAAAAENYYRTMVRGDRASWNIRDEHMTDTIERISHHVGIESKGVIWEHNTHIGDARATDMAHAGMVNVGQLMRERFGVQEVGLVGFASHRGTVLAASAWGEPEITFQVPPAVEGSHEDLLHQSLGSSALLVLDPNRVGPWISDQRGHRAIGVVYNPHNERGNYVPTVMGQRYDALVWLEETRALEPIHHELQPREPEYETEPTGF